MRDIDIPFFVFWCLQWCLQTSLSWRTWRFWTCSITRLRSFPLRSAAFRSWSTSTLGDFPFSNVVYGLKLWRLWVFSVCKLLFCLFSKYEPSEHLAQRVWFFASSGGFGCDLQQPEPELPAWELLLPQWVKTHTHTLWNICTCNTCSLLEWLELTRRLSLQQLFVLSISATMTLKPSPLTSRSCQSCKL